MGIFEGRLKLEAQVLVKPTSLLVGRGHYPRDPLAAKLHERVVEAKPQVLTAQPLSSRDCRNVHQQICAVEVLVQDTCDEPLFEVKQPDGRSPPGSPSTPGPGTNPRADDVVFTDENFFQSTPPVS